MRLLHRGGVMRKYLVMLVLVLAIIIFFILNKKEISEPLTIINDYKKEWGIDLPIPDKRKEIWGTEGSFNGDGEWFNVFDYSSQEVPIKNSGMVEITSMNIEEVKSKIERFRATTISLYTGDTQEHVNKALAEYLIRVQEGDYYFYREENNGFDYFIALFKTEENKLYTMEWHQ